MADKQTTGKKKKAAPASRGNKTVASHSQDVPVNKSNFNSTIEDSKMPLKHEHGGHCANVAPDVQNPLSSASPTVQNSATDDTLKSSVCDMKSTTETHSVESTDTTSDVTQKSKGQLRAERRLIQEAQRAQKAANKLSGGVGGGGQKDPPNAKSSKPVEKVQQVMAENETPKKGQTSGTGMVVMRKQDQTPGTGQKDAKIRVPVTIQIDDQKIVRKQSKKLEKQNVPKRPTSGQKKVSLFIHLVQYERNTDWIHERQLEKNPLHRSVWKLGLQYMEGTICGSNARCIALLNTMKEVIADYKTPPNTELSRELEVYIRPFIGFLNQCRQLSVSMGNAIKYLKHQITQIEAEVSEKQAKKILLEAIDYFIRVRILLAGQAISNEVSSSIRNGDVILVYSCSSLVRRVLQDAHKKGIQFSVIVADGRPMLEGRLMLQRLVEDGINCSYILINSVTYVMPQVTTVLLGAHALLTNGFVMSRVGSSQVAMIAKAYNIPVIVVCETYKFCERAQTDSFVLNELGDPDDLVTVSNGALSCWRTLSPLYVLNLVYDVTPPNLLTNVITELGSIPCASVPVVLRVKFSES